MMNERLVFILLLCVIVVLWRTIGYWRKRAGEAVFTAAQMTDKTEEHDRLCRLAVRAGHRDACRMFCCLHPDLFEKQPPLKPFKLHDTRAVFYGLYHCPNLSSGLYDIDVFEPRECLHEAIGHENRILERNYRILGDIKGKEVIIVDDVLTTGQSMSDYKREIERCGGKVVAAIFYGKTITMPHPLIVKLEVWGDYITRFSKSN